jgi:4-hydroxybenzoate polyprenyltransferase
MARRPPSELAFTEASPAGEASSRSAASNLLISLRPQQWTKNLIVFGGLLFGRQLLDSGSVLKAGAAFAVFCALSGVVYLINDVADRERDRQHPFKRHRPVASGALSPSTALGAAAVLAIAATGAAVTLGARFAVIAVTYVILQVLYSAWLKHLVIIDVLTLAFGFVLRAVAGAVVINVEISHWLLTCTMLLALFLALSKRRHELILLAEGATSHRRILQEYTPYLLDQMIGVVTASTLMAYIFYTISPETTQKFGPYLGLTVPFPIYGIFRYLYLVHQKEGGGSPSEMLLTDKPLLACVALWAITVAVVIYAPGLRAAF